MASDIEGRDFPSQVTSEDLRRKLHESQLKDKELGPIVRQLQAKQNPSAFKKSATGQAKPKGPLRPAVAQTVRLADDGVLEPRVLLHQGEPWVPYLPNEAMPYTAPEVSWRRWVFDQLHCSLMHSHRTYAETYNLMRRTAYWPYMARDCAEWHKLCEVCAQNRGSTMRPPMKSIYAQ